MEKAYLCGKQTKCSQQMRNGDCPSPSGESPQFRRLREHKEKEGRRREKLAAYFFDLSKLVFASLAIGGITPFFLGGGEGNWVVVLFGVIATYTFASIGNRILK